MLNRQNNLDRLLQSAQTQELWDLVVIGGGATGLGAALDAASRGLKVCLLESHDFAKGTSSRATKLAHGGVRYLAQGNFSLVREALEERGRMLRNAPNLVKPLAFVIPAYRWFDKLFYWIGLKLYDVLAGRLGVGPTTMLNIKSVIDKVPRIKKNDLRGGVRYFDAQFDDARLAIALLKSLHKLGGVALNYAPVKSFVMNNDTITGVQFECKFSGQSVSLRAKAVINATGVWVDEVRRLANPRSHGLLSPSQGVHVVVDRVFHPSDEALLVPKTEDGRVLFVVPWLGKTLIGTTDTPRADSPREPLPLDGEVDFVLRTAAQYLDHAPVRADVTSVFVGLRPLVKAGEGQNTKSISREHTILTEPNGLTTITGGKWTTYRSMAEEVVDEVSRLFRLTSRPSGTRELRLEDGIIDTSSEPVLDERAPLTRSEILRAVREEMAVTIEDVLARRSRVLFLHKNAALACVDQVMEILASELSLSSEELNRQRVEFEQVAAQYGLD